MVAKLVAVEMIYPWPVDLGSTGHGGRRRATTSMVMTATTAVVGITGPRDPRPPGRSALPFRRARPARTKPRRVWWGGSTRPGAVQRRRPAAPRGHTAD